MKCKKFTDMLIRRLRPREKRFDLTGPKGLCLRISPSGVKTWVYVYRFHGRLRRMTLGRYPDLSIGEADAKHADARLHRLHDEDPAVLGVQKRQELLHAPTVKVLVSEYLERHAKPHKRTWREDERILNREVIPRFGARKAADLRRREVIAMLDEIAARAPVQANQTLSVFRKCFNWAISRDLVEFSPCHRIERPAPDSQRDRYLSKIEIQKFLGILRQRRLKDPKIDLEMSETVKAALVFALATGQRAGEVTGASWSEFDLSTATWEIPASRVKTGRTHRIPLNKPALAALRRARELGPQSEWPFPSPGGKKPLASRVLGAAIHRNHEKFGLPPFTAHDLRRTCATHLAQFGVPRFIIGRILNHAESGVTRVYDRYQYFREMKTALDRWGRFLENLK